MFTDACVPSCSSQDEHICKLAQTLGKHRAGCAWCRLGVELRVRAFGMGFIAGTQSSQLGGSHGRTVVEPATHAHWRRGFDAGKAAHVDATNRYRNEITNKGE